MSEGRVENTHEFGLNSNQRTLHSEHIEGERNIMKINIEIFERVLCCQKVYNNTQAIH